MSRRRRGRGKGSAIPESVSTQADAPHPDLGVEQQVSDVDEVIVVTGFCPDVSALSGVRLDLDPVLSSTRALAAEIDPSFHSCGDGSPHRYEELTPPEENTFIVGMSFYGRAPSFLAMTGFEQVRSVRRPGRRDSRVRLQASSRRCLASRATSSFKSRAIAA